MGNPLFGINISGLVNKHIAPGLLDVVISRPTQGVRVSLTEAPTPGTPIKSTAKGYWKNVEPDEADGDLLLVTDRIAAIVGDSINPPMIPQTEDSITIEGITLIVVRLLKRDAAAATYRFLCRDRAGNA